MSFREFQGIVNEFARRLSLANNDEKRSDKRNEAISYFIRRLDQWELPLKSFTPTVIEICDVTNQSVKQQFISVMDELQSENIPDYIRYILAEVIRFSKSENLFELLKEDVDNALNKLNCANNALNKFSSADKDARQKHFEFINARFEARAAHDAWITATNVLDNYVQRNMYCNL